LSVDFFALMGKSLAPFQLFVLQDTRLAKGGARPTKAGWNGASTRGEGAWQARLNKLAAKAVLY
jgi:hypothetical protein